jgi:UDP-glucose 4-epimerase
MAAMHVLVTGGAGFIGSHLVDALVAEGHDVRILDDFTTGYLQNVNPAADVIEGDISDETAVAKAVNGADVVFHEAAHRSVARSVDDPLATDRANTYGTLLILNTAREAGAQRVIYASSSSVYGGAEQRPTPETAPLQPRSPYAVTKFAGEQYARVFSELYKLPTIALRYFNVFGPRQRPDSRYAAVIPLFIEALRQQRAPTVEGDGKQTRDFTFVEDVVRANLAAMSADAATCSGKAYNIAGGNEYSLLDMLDILRRIIGSDVQANHVDARSGDVRHSCADVQKAAKDLGWTAQVGFEEGLARTVGWFN